MTTTHWEDLRGERRLDSRDIIEAAENLRAELEDESREPTDEETAFFEEVEYIEGCSEDWIYGAGMIHADDFEDYARELAEDIGAIDSDAGWPARCIDWEQAARELAMDYTSVEFLGHDYYVR